MWRRENRLHPPQIDARRSCGRGRGEWAGGWDAGERGWGPGGGEWREGADERVKMSVIAILRQQSLALFVKAAHSPLQNCQIGRKRGVLVA
jgi:hypothetical protein